MYITELNVGKQHLFNSNQDQRESDDYLISFLYLEIIINVIIVVDVIPGCRDEYLLNK